MTGKIPLYFPVRSYWTNLTAALMLAVGLSIIVNKWAQTAAVSLAVFLLLINLLNHGYLLADNPHEPILWTGAMLDLAVTFGIMIFALSRSPESKV